MNSPSKRPSSARLALAVALSLELSVWARPRPARANALDAGLSAISARVVADDVEGALGLLSGLPSETAGQAELRYLTARLHERRGQIAEALAAMPETLEGAPEPVQRDAMQRRALWLARLSRCPEARPLLSLLLEKSKDTELSLAAARCALGEGDAASALALLQGVNGNGGKSVAVRLLLARTLARTGSRKQAAAILRELLVERPEHAQIDEAQRELSQLTGKLALSDEERLLRAEKLLAALQAERALAELDRLRAPKAKAIRARALHLRGTALFRLRTRYPEAAKVLAKAAAERGSSTQGEDAYRAAQALARADRDAEAVRAFRAFAKTFPEHPLAVEALHDAAWLELRHDLPGAESHMRGFLAEADKRGNKDAAQSGLWELAFYLFGRARYAEALPLFERYAQSSEYAMVRARGLYWAGRAALFTGQRPLALQRFAEAIAVEPLHWYALLSRERLLQLGEQVPPAFAPSPVPAPAPANAATATAPSVPIAPPVLPLPAEVEFYARLGLVSDAVSAMRGREGELRAGLSTEAGLIALCESYRRISEHARPYRLAEAEHAGAIKRAPVGLDRAYWDLLFPRPYAEDVAEISQSEKLPEDFVYSVMRKESAFDPNVVSSADAIGLLQLIEPTARTMARQLGIGPWKRTLLYQPRTNIRLGARYLANLLARYGDQPVPAIAAYNAGEHRVGAWLARAKKRTGAAQVELDRWVEDIPIDQTRNYVRRVVANWARYRYLENPAAQWPALSIPEWLNAP